jgi:hypothetical protein
VKSLRDQLGCTVFDDGLGLAIGGLVAETSLLSGLDAGLFARFQLWKFFHIFRWPTATLTELFLDFHADRGALGNREVLAQIVFGQFAEDDRVHIDHAIGTMQRTRDSRTRR